MADINWALIAPLIIIEMILKVVALVDWVKYKQNDRSKWIWLIVILLINLFGPVLYFIFGRRQQ